MAPSREKIIMSEEQITNDQSKVGKESKQNRLQEDSEGHNEDTSSSLENPAIEAEKVRASEKLHSYQLFESSLKVKELPTIGETEDEMSHSESKYLEGNHSETGFSDASIEKLSKIEEKFVSKMEETQKKEDVKPKETTKNVGNDKTAFKNKNFNVEMVAENQSRDIMVKNSKQPSQHKKTYDKVAEVNTQEKNLDLIEKNRIDVVKDTGSNLDGTLIEQVSIAEVKTVKDTTGINNFTIPEKKAISDDQNTNQDALGDHIKDETKIENQAEETNQKIVPTRSSRINSKTLDDGYSKEKQPEVEDILEDSRTGGKRLEEAAKSNMNFTHISRKDGEGSKDIKSRKKQPSESTCVLRRKQTGKDASSEATDNSLSISEESCNDSIENEELATGQEKFEKEEELKTVITSTSTEGRNENRKTQKENKRSTKKKIKNEDREGQNDISPRVPKDKIIRTSSSSDSSEVSDSESSYEISHKSQNFHSSKEDEFKLTPISLPLTETHPHETSDKTKHKQKLQKPDTKNGRIEVCNVKI